MKHIEINIDSALSFIDEANQSKYLAKSVENISTLYKGTGKGNDFLGWLNLPSEIIEDDLQDIEDTAKGLREKLDVMVVIGIGGSYLGAKAMISALSGSFDDFSKDKMKVVYAGHNLSEDYIHELLQFLDDKRFGICVISKSGTTTEPAVSFRLLKSLLESQVGKFEASKRIVAITDRSKGALRILADQEGYKTYVVEDNIGGRFSVLTPVGLFPLAVAGYDIRKFVEGAIYMQEHVKTADENNIAVQYSNVRNLLYDQGKKIELFASFNPKLHFIGEWWKQLYGESEGKGGKGLFPASVDFTTDLHSMGQYIQDGERHLFETLISVNKEKNNVIIPSDDADLDKLNYISGKRIGFVNSMAEKGTMQAHFDGGVPLINISMPEINEYYLGELIYFYEVACGMSAYVLDVNPFDQPGVEEYKKNMFALLGKEGY
ncbi:MAG: glucose-6-phosphate isomerase [Marinifilaceae bacterium]